MNDLAVRQPEQRPLDAHDPRCGRRFTRTNLWRAEGRGLAVGHVEHVNLVSLRSQADDRPAHAEFLVVRVRAAYEDRCHGGRWYAAVSAASLVVQALQQQLQRLGRARLVPRGEARAADGDGEREVTLR